jgi:cytochrome P450
MAAMNLDEAVPVSASDQASALLASASLIDPAISARPKPYYDAMRAQDPVHYDEKLGSWLISRYEDIATIQRDPITFSVKHGFEAQYAKGFQAEFKSILIAQGGGFFPDAIMTDPPYHTRIRRLMENAFTAHRVKALEAGITSIIVDVIDTMIAKAHSGQPIDAVQDFGIPITIRVICEQLGIEQYNADKIQKWSHAVTQQIGSMQDHQAMIGFAEDVCELQNFLIAEIRKRETEPSEDMISDLVHATTIDPDHPRLTFEEVVSLIRATMIAGNETTATGMANLVRILATQPKVFELLKNSAGDERMMSRFVEELLRVAPPVRALSRMTTREVEVGGKLLPAGAHMLLVYASGNDDEAEFPAPGEFDPGRGNLGRHVSFGGGPHKCIGIALARMELRVAARELIKRVSSIELAIAEDDIRYLPTVATYSIASLPITLVKA